MVAYRLGTGKVPGSNPGNGENFSVKEENHYVKKKGLDAVHENCPQRSNMRKIVICNVCVMMTEI